MARLLGGMAGVSECSQFKIIQSCITRTTKLSKQDFKELQK